MHSPSLNTSEVFGRQELGDCLRLIDLNRSQVCCCCAAIKRKSHEMSEAKVHPMQCK